MACLSFQFDICRGGKEDCLRIQTLDGHLLCVQCSDVETISGQSCYMSSYDTCFVLFFAALKGKYHPKIEMALCVGYIVSKLAF